MVEMSKLRVLCCRKLEIGRHDPLFDMSFDPLITWYMNNETLSLSLSLSLLIPDEEKWKKERKEHHSSSHSLSSEGEEKRKTKVSQLTFYVCLVYTMFGMRIDRKN